ncbi:MAG TPA: PLP-dependent cysteine synthase family protein [Devosia sp.]|jgi:cysteine synthase A|nr:PLP-dependent cysteine synthase family protein [Devosia sp.]
MSDRDWTDQAIRKIEADFTRSADTHLERLDLPALAGITIYLKDESTHPTGSLKHRLARSLFLYGLCNGWIHAGSLVVDASSGSTAISEAYFARLLGLKFVAVMPRSTSPEKIAQIEFYGGKCHFVDDAGAVYDESRRLAEAASGHYLDQFTFAERATDWRGNNNIAEAMFQQMAREEHACPSWVVCGAGTGGTSATIGRFIRYRQFKTRLCVVDPGRSVFFDFYESGDRNLTAATGSRIEGIGRPRVEPSFIPDLVDRMIKVPDAASFAAMRVLSELIGRRVGGSTGTNLMGVLQIAAEMRASSRHGSIVTLICDSGRRYEQSYFNDDWLQANGFEVAPWEQKIRAFMLEGRWDKSLQQPSHARSDVDLREGI